MIKLPQRFLVALILAASVVVPSTAYALDSVGYDSPIGKGATVQSLLTKVIQFLLALVGTLALLALIVGGIRIILGFADENQVKSGKQIIYWAIIGLIIVILSYSMISIVNKLLTT